MKKILILATNPQATSHLHLDNEVREIEDALRRSHLRDLFQMEQRWVSRPRDVQRALLDVKPQIVHFCGHEQGQVGLVLEDDTGRIKLVSEEALSKLFKLFADKIECVLLNVGYSEVQAEAIAQHINYVIGMRQAISNRAAIEFAVGFYDALGAGRSIEDAFDFGCITTDLQGIPESLTPVLKKKLSQKKAPLGL